MNNVGKHTAALILVLGLWTTVNAAEWPQFRGPHRDGQTTESGLLKTWPKDGPKLLWTVDGLGEGWSSAAVSGDGVYVTGMEKKSEFLSAIDLRGQLTWKTRYGSAWGRSHPGARTTPTIDAGRLYVISGGGEVVCLNGQSGQIIWTVNGTKTFAGTTGNWGTAESALIDGNKVFYTPCGPRTTVVALDKMTGETLWTTDSIDDRSAYVSPVLIEHGGTRLLVTVTAAYIIGVDTEKGTIVWKYAYARNHPTTESENRLFINAVSPVYHDGRVFVTSGYDHVGVMLDLSADGTAIRRRWLTDVLDCHHGGVVLLDGCIYGSNWLSNASGNWICLDWDTGKVRYDNDWQNNKGPVIAADGMLYCWDEDEGDVALVKATPSGFDPVSTFKVTVGKGKFWAHPSIANGRLYLRHGQSLQAHDIRAD